MIIRSRLRIGGLLRRWVQRCETVVHQRRAEIAFTEAHDLVDRAPQQLLGRRCELWHGAPRSSRHSLHGSQVAHITLTTVPRPLASVICRRATSAPASW